MKETRLHECFALSQMPLTSHEVSLLLIYPAPRKELGIIKGSQNIASVLSGICIQGTVISGRQDDR